jgi:hypothetical protein
MSMLESATDIGNGRCFHEGATKAQFRYGDEAIECVLDIID